MNSVFKEQHVCVKYRRNKSILTCCLLPGDIVSITGAGYCGKEKRFLWHVLRDSDLTDVLDLPKEDYEELFGEGSYVR